MGSLMSLHPMSILNPRVMFFMSAAKTPLNAIFALNYVVTCPGVAPAMQVPSNRPDDRRL